MESTKEYGSPSGVKSLGIRVKAFLPTSPLKEKGKNIIHDDIFPEPKNDSKKILGNSIKEMKNRGDAKVMFATIFIFGYKIKFYCTLTYFHEAKNEENKRLGLLLDEQKAELIGDEDEVDRLQRLKEIAEDEALALKLQEEKEKGLKKKKGGKKRACSSSKGRRIKKRAGRIIEEEEEKVVHQDIQPKEEPEEVGEIEQKSREVHHSLT